MTNKPKLVVFTGAGISAESGLGTFRDAGGTWEQYDVEDVCTVQALERNRALVFQFFNDARRAVRNAQPNAGHYALAELEDQFDVVVITQNVDDLHERAGSTNVIHLHGDIQFMRHESTGNLSLWADDLPVDGNYRPHVVLFGEMPENFEQAVEECIQADVAMIVGTSLQVYPAANLAQMFNCTLKFVVDPNLETVADFVPVPEPASTGCVRVAKLLRSYPR